jgi:hypothetical protein
MTLDVDKVHFANPLPRRCQGGQKQAECPVNSNYINSLINMTNRSSTGMSFAPSSFPDVMSARDG